MCRYKEYKEYKGLGNNLYIDFLFRYLETDYSYALRREPGARWTGLIRDGYLWVLRRSVSSRQVERLEGKPAKDGVQKWLIARCLLGTQSLAVGLG